MTDGEDIDSLAAEYVLGTLDTIERANVAARRSRDPALDTAIAAWERRLQPLNGLTAEVEAPSGIWPAIEARIDRDDSAGPNSNVIDLERGLARWRKVAIAASAMAASLIVVIGLREFQSPSRPQNYVAVFQKDDASPAFLLSIDLNSRQLTIRPVAAEAPPGKTYQLWIATAQQGGRPQSLGLIDQQGYTTRAALASYEPTVVQAATFGVSLEPSGGSPTGQPTGPVFHAKLLPSTP